MDELPIRIAVNGFGRIGRTLLRVLSQRNWNGFELVAMNDLAPIDTAAHLLEFDSVFGRFPEDVLVNGTGIQIGGRHIRFTNERDPAALNWSDIDIVLECTGIAQNEQLARGQIGAGARRVLVSGPCKGADKTIVLGANDGELESSHRVVSNASCTTNAIAPLVRLIDDSVGLLKANMTTVHCYTGSQPTLDKASSTLERSRAGALSIVPTTTSAFRMLDAVLPDLANRVDGSAIRVPTPSVSSVDLVFEAKTSTSIPQLHELLEYASPGPVEGVIKVDKRPLVSTDMRATSASVTIMSTLSAEVGDGLFRLFGWYDNEWGFSCRMVELAKKMVMQDRANQT